MTAACWWGEAWGSPSPSQARDSWGLSCLSSHWILNKLCITFSPPAFSVTLLHVHQSGPHLLQKSWCTMEDVIMATIIMKTDGFNITNDIQAFYEEVYDWGKGGSATIHHLDLVKAQFIGEKILYSRTFLGNEVLRCERSRPPDI